ncbi:hypothetical protein MKY63_00735 [Paenibacillus sp. FSL R7-0189]|uniref:hypothetical protein n=1 Tax=Paenibacillus sp. FSL R7-0189 TaxID=2921673 RepID=UPI0030DA56BA
MANIKRTKECVSSELLRLAAEGHPMTSTKVPSYLVRSAQTYFGSWKNAISELGITQTRAAYVETAAIRGAYENRRIWTDDVVSEALRMSSSDGITPMEFRKRFDPMGDALDRRFGGVLQACDYFGISRLPRDNTDPYKFAGHSFEEVLGDIFHEIGVHYVKERRGDCIPDFIVGDSWYDAKLSETTINLCKTVEKYEPNCESLTIVFLRGNKNADRKLTNKTRILHISHFLKRLPEKRQVHYNRKLDDILNTLNCEILNVA